MCFDFITWIIRILSQKIDETVHRIGPGRALRLRAAVVLYHSKRELGHTHWTSTKVPSSMFKDRPVFPS
jgi:hypothetical protein